METVRAHVIAMADLRAVQAILDEAEIDWLVFKGPVLGSAAHGGPDLRTYSDVDLLVSPARLAAAVEAFEKAGLEVLDRNWRLLRSELKGEVHVRLPHGTVADLHWSVINDRRARKAFDVTTERLMNRARWLAVDGLEVRTFDPVDTLLHLCLHTVTSGGHRLLWFKDIERVLVNDPPDWDTLLERSRVTQLGPLVALALRQTQALVGARVPAAVCEGLARSRAWQIAGVLANRVAPPERSIGYGSVTRMVNRATRPALGASLRELARRTLGWIRRIGKPRGREGELIREDSPGSMSFAAGGADDRAAFFEAVSRER